MDAAQWTFMHSQIMSLSVSAAVVRSRPLPVYCSEASEELRRGVQLAIRAKLAGFEPQYIETQSDEAHVQNITDLATSISQGHAATLVNGVLRIGTAQKALNLYLKYLWCLGRIKEPPHCPIDAIVLGHAHEVANVRWTQMNDIEEYKRCINSLRLQAQERKLSLSCWELQLWNEAQPAVQADAAAPRRLTESV